MGRREEPGRPLQAAAHGLGRPDTGQHSSYPFLFRRCPALKVYSCNSSHRRKIRRQLCALRKQGIRVESFGTGNPKKGADMLHTCPLG